MDSGIGPEALRLLRGIAAAAAKHQGLADISHAGAELGLSAAQVDALQVPLYAPAWEMSASPWCCAAAAAIPRSRRSASGPIPLSTTLSLLPPATMIRWPAVRIRGGVSPERCRTEPAPAPSARRALPRPRLPQDAGTPRRP